MQALILHSVDGQEWVHVVLYPDTWTSGDADTKAIEAFKAAQAIKPDDWSWEDYEPELEARGFTLVPWHHGPTWDEGHIE